MSLLKLLVVNDNYTWLSEMRIHAVRCDRRFRARPMRDGQHMYVLCSVCSTTLFRWKATDAEEKDTKVEKVPKLG